MPKPDLNIVSQLQRYYTSNLDCGLQIGGQNHPDPDARGAISASLIHGRVVLVRVKNGALVFYSMMSPDQWQKAGRD